MRTSDRSPSLRYRLQAASRHVASFGIATECGIARSRTPELVRRLLQAHADASSEPAA
jgi:hypothetical protein